MRDVGGDVTVRGIAGGVYLSEGAEGDTRSIAQAGAFGEVADIDVIESQEHRESESGFRGKCERCEESEGEGGWVVIGGE
jgi:hypothetical protein